MYVFLIAHSANFAALFYVCSAAICILPRQFLLSWFGWMQWSVFVKISQWLIVSVSESFWQLEEYPRKFRITALVCLDREDWHF